MALLTASNTNPPPTHSAWSGGSSDHWLPLATPKRCWKWLMPEKLVPPEADETDVLAAGIPARPGPPRVALARDERLRFATASRIVAASGPTAGASSPPPFVPRLSVVFWPPWMWRVVIVAPLALVPAASTLMAPAVARTAAAIRANGALRFMCSSTSTRARTRLGTFARNRSASRGAFHRTCAHHED